MANEHATRESDRCVFILGAGASVQHGNPVMNDFMSKARGRFHALRKTRNGHPLIAHYQRMFEFQDECFGCSWAVNRNWDNIEELYTQADLLRLMGKGGATAICESVALSIWDTYREVDEGNLPPAAEVCAMLNSRGLKPVVITTNYDCLWEVAIARERGLNFYYPGLFPPWHHGTFARTAKKFDPGILWEWNNEGLEPKRSDKVLPILKLHGSVNWFVDPAEEACLASTILNKTEISEKWRVTSPEFDLNAFTAQFLRPDGSNRNVIPLIVPPMLGKTSQMALVRQTWLAATHFLQRARYIVIVGYSFPQTDAFMSRLLAEGLKENRGLERIVLVDLQKESDWEQRKADLFTPSMLRNKFRFESVPAHDYLLEIAGGRRQIN